MTADELVLRPSKVRWALILLGCVVLGGGSVGMVLNGAGVAMRDVPFGDVRAWGVAGLLLFGFGIPISLIQLFSTSNYLRLSPDGFTVASTPLRTRTWRWSDVGQFSIDVSYTRGVKTVEHVTYELRPGLVPGHRTMSSMVAAMGGRLPDTYGMKAHDLAALMNGWRERYAR